MSIVLITPPRVEPVTVSDMMTQLGMGIVSDQALASTLNAQIGAFIASATRYCQAYTRSVYVTQKWLWRRDGFPGRAGHHHEGERGSLWIPRPPFLAMEFVRYVDPNGAVQTLPVDNTYGVALAGNYAYQLSTGSETEPARMSPAWLSPWPWTRRVEDSVSVQFKCGFGGPVACSMQPGSPILSGPVFLAGEAGQNITVPGAAANGGDLETTILSVDADGQATLTANATTQVTNVNAWVGRPIPPEITQAIKFMTQFFYEQGSVVDVPVPRVVQALLDPYRNLVA